METGPIANSETTVQVQVSTEIPKVCRRDVELVEIVLKAMSDIKEEGKGRNKRVRSSEDDHVLNLLIRKYDLTFLEYHFLWDNYGTGKTRIEGLVNYASAKTESEEDYLNRFYTKNKPKRKAKSKTKTVPKGIVNLNIPEGEMGHDNTYEVEEMKTGLVDELKEKVDELKAAKLKKYNDRIKAEIAESKKEKPTEIAESKKEKPTEIASLPSDSDEDVPSENDGESDNDGESENDSASEPEIHPEPEKCTTRIAKGKRKGEECGRTNCKMHNRKKD